MLQGYKDNSQGPTNGDSKLDNIDSALKRFTVSHEHILMTDYINEPQHCTVSSVFYLDKYAVTLVHVCYHFPGTSQQANEQTLQLRT